MEENNTNAIRLNKAISDTGFCSRRGADKIIEEGRVTHQALSIQLKLLEASNSMLQQEREDLQQALNDALLL